MLYYDNKTFSDNQFSIYLIEKYVNKHFKYPDKVKANYTPGQIARLIGEIDIAFFALYYMREIFVVSDDNAARELAPAHYEIWDVLNKVFVDDLMDKVNLVEPRGIGKSTIADLLLSIWVICYKKSVFTLLGAKKDDDATQFLDSVKISLSTCNKIAREFGELINPKKNKPNSSDKYKVNSNEIEFTNGTYIRAVGSASSVRGANWGGVRPTVVILDDYQSEADILTEDAREKKYNKFTKEVEQVGDTAVYRGGKKVKKATKIINIGKTVPIKNRVKSVKAKYFK